VGAKLSAGIKLFGFVVVVFAANLMAVKWFQYPIVYCAGDSFVKPLVAPIMVFVNLAAMLWFFAKMAVRDYYGAFFVGVVTILIFGIPDYIDILFRLGSSCG